jgi:hypothetical protein
MKSIDLSPVAAANTMACLWTLIFSCMVIAAAFVLKKVRPRGFSWGWRLLIAFGIFYMGILIQAFTSLPFLSAPDLIGSAIPPVMIGSLQMEYTDGLTQLGMNMNEAFEAARPLAFKYGICRFVLFLSFACLWILLKKVEIKPAESGGKQ